ncbi:MAG: NTP/NDP exchange transporter [Candidatus Rariloculaceae bacterium]
MTSSQSAETGGTDWIKAACWLVIGAWVLSKLMGLMRGESVGALFDFANPSLAGLAAAAGLIILILRSPRILRSATLIEPNEARTVALAFTFVFILMAAYYILRPVRDAMASDWTNTEIALLWNIQLVISTAVVALYGFACSRIRFNLLVPVVYIFFAVSFVAFYCAASFVTDRVLIDKAFYLWVTVFALLHLSVFWSFMADLFNKEQARRVFGFIAAGATAGGAVGPLVAALIVTDVGVDNLMLIASAMLLIPLPIIFYLQRLKAVDLHNEDVNADLSAAKLGGNPFAGFKAFFTNPYLLGIGAFILLYTTIGSFVYFEQTNLLREFTREERTVILSGLAATVNILTFGLALFATSRLVTKLGMPITLALVPVFICAGLLILAFAPILTVLLALQVARQAGNYGVTRPAREMLFTHVDRETRFKSKPVIDVAVYRGGDALSSLAFAGLTDGIGLGIAAMAGIGAGIAAVWAAAGVYIGRVFSSKNDADEAQSDSTAVGMAGKATASSSA